MDQKVSKAYRDQLDRKATTALKVCLDPRDPRVNQERMVPTVLMESRAVSAPKGTKEILEFKGHRGSKDHQAHEGLKELETSASVFIKKKMVHPLQLVRLRHQMPC